MKKLILGILVLGISLLLAGCGTEEADEGTETENLSETETGAYAVDFAAAPGVVGFITLDQPTDSVQSLENKELTIEAWVKTKEHPVNKTLVLPPYGSIFAIGSDFEGIMLWIDEGGWTSFTMLVFPGVAVTDESNRYSVRSVTVLDEANNWYHIAAVLVNNAHSHYTDDTENPDCYNAQSEQPHVDIYINGVFDNCGSTGANFTGDLDYVRKELGTCNGDEGVDYVNVDGFCYPLDKDGNKFKFTGSIGRSQSDWWWPGGEVDRLTPARRFIGIIDEVRFWNVARTADEISENYKREIESQYGLIGYWRLNEGEGNIVLDSSGSGKGGVKMYSDVQGDLVWEEGWVAGDWE